MLRQDRYIVLKNAKILENMTRDILSRRSGISRNYISGVSSVSLIQTKAVIRHTVLVQNGEGQGLAVVLNSAVFFTEAQTSSLKSERLKYDYKRSIGGPVQVNSHKGNSSLHKWFVNEVV